MKQQGIDNAIAKLNQPLQPKQSNNAFNSVINTQNKPKQPNTQNNTKVTTNANKGLQQANKYVNDNFTAGNTDSMIPVHLSKAMDKSRFTPATPNGHTTQRVDVANAMDDFNAKQTDLITKFNDPNLSQEQKDELNAKYLQLQNDHAGTRELNALYKAGDTAKSDARKNILERNKMTMFTASPLALDAENLDYQPSFNDIENRLQRLTTDPVAFQKMKNALKNTPEKYNHLNYLNNTAAKILDNYAVKTGYTMDNVLKPVIDPIYTTNPVFARRYETMIDNLEFKGKGQGEFSSFRLATQTPNGGLIQLQELDPLMMPNLKTKLAGYDTEKQNYAGQCYALFRDIMHKYGVEGSKTQVKFYMDNTSSGTGGSIRWVVGSPDLEFTMNWGDVFKEYDKKKALMEIDYNDPLDMQMRESVYFGKNISRGRKDDLLKGAGYNGLFDTFHTIIHEAGHAVLKQVADFFTDKLGLPKDYKASVFAGVACMQYALNKVYGAYELKVDDYAKLVIDYGLNRTDLIRRYNGRVQPDFEEWFVDIFATAVTGEYTNDKLGTVIKDLLKNKNWQDVEPYFINAMNATKDAKVMIKKKRRSNIT